MMRPIFFDLENYEKPLIEHYELLLKILEQEISIYVGNDIKNIRNI